ncbi:MAG: S1 RNA-binding domain-containing protein [Chloroflexi bacterium]|nr:S1 RNA-binding domain-containing protein [Chloroflexota bacterium]
MQEPDLESFQMADLLDQDISPRQYQAGEVVEVEVIRLDDEGLVVDVGQKMEGLVPIQEMRSLEPGAHARIEPGQRINVTIMGERGPGGMALLSLDQALEDNRWQQLEQQLQEGAEVTARIVEQNRGGLVVDCQGVRGFVPFSHLAPIPGGATEEALAARMHEQAQFHILELDRSQQRLVLTERAIGQKRREEAQDQYLAELEEGTVLSGKVSSIRGFGAFVDVGEIEGLIPISELSWRMVKSPDEVVTVGDQLEVVVLRVERETRRLTLSLKRTQPEPWETVHDRYEIHQIVQGTVTNLAQFGAFVKLEDGIEGLIHISELSQRRVNNPKECVYQGQHVRVMILSIDSQQRRIGLSYKQAFGL